MSIQPLEKFLPDNCVGHLKKWFTGHSIHIKITRDRKSKLGDYRKMRDGSHEITINSTLQPELFFFVFTHELAHLLAFEKYGRRIAPHGNEWKHTFRAMLLESLDVYSEDLQPIIIRFSRSPKANFMASPELVKYFRFEKSQDGGVFVETLKKGEVFVYQNQRYVLEGLIKKNYLCVNLETGRKYAFRPLARVQNCI
ncbi:transcription elongation protein SprT [Chryseobacterium sp. Leaf404]|uniref:SprT-like domain-containing protein n=1 Tax=unclassified Chryseobacterium TaxID=2593645 RepID=UPI0006FED823|nr:MULTISPECIES: SprT-like domain-containing protein [unclassified Chryseobacterium]KQT22424.1 transcription elongation protein SprT [Chryseobacterium sp. Leaf404]